VRVLGVFTSERATNIASSRDSILSEKRLLVPWFLETTYHRVVYFQNKTEKKACDR